MKVRFIIILLSFFVVSLSAYAGSESPQTLPEKQISLKDKINLNTADLPTLTGSFKGIGKKRAEAIITYRQSHKGFKSLEELAEVKGLGQNFVEKNREKLQEVFVVN
ncbi:competence protein ComEA [Legionella norrlandica]|uniref:Competence protein ComEA n=1 Tax=Legionella norrlandica TaxID=1498499 RepID=A0A0A2SQA8_9GAMM|nr:helix-hairpin-helix domain-containing protein [Legionella norrlandica]KGP62907.1 competence protein ComEA [Legionella norrlandica]